MSLSLATANAPAARSPAPIADLEREFIRSPYWSLRQLRCFLRDGHIVLCGSVTTYYLKQLALATAAKVAGVGCVTVEIEVQPSEGGNAAPLPAGATAFDARTTLD